MKKILIAIIALFGFTLTTVAQADAKKTIKKTETVVKKTEKDGKTIISKTKETKVVLKKDGTPDKRYKNAEVKNVVLKKDGTPDKRYKN